MSGIPVSCIPPHSPAQINFVTEQIFNQFKATGGNYQFPCQLLISDIIATFIAPLKKKKLRNFKCFIDGTFSRTRVSNIILVF